MHLNTEDLHLFKHIQIASMDRGSNVRPRSLDQMYLVTYYIVGQDFFGHTVIASNDVRTPFIHQAAAASTGPWGG